MTKLEATMFTDPACPFAYSASPALAVLHWRYGDQLQWRIVTIGLAEDPKRYVDAGYTPARMSLSAMHFRRYGMPFLAEPRARVTATSRACRAIVAARLAHPGREASVLRALQLAWFNTTELLDEDEPLRRALAEVEGIDAAALVEAIDAPDTLAAYEQDKDETRQAEGGPTHFQGKARQTDGPVRYSAPSLVFRAADGRSLEGGGFQPIEAYDVLIANLDPQLERRAPAEEPLSVLSEFPEGLVTAEVAAIMAQNNELPDLDRAEAALVELAGEGSVRRTAIGDGALWQLA